MFLQSKSNRQRFISYTNTESINFIEINVNNYGFAKNQTFQGTVSSLNTF